MTPLIAALIALIVLLWVTAFVLVLRRMRHRLPSPDAPSDHYEELTERLRLVHEHSVQRTAALNRELDHLARRKGRDNG